jgi:hypothetical protein
MNKYVYKLGEFSGSDYLEFRKGNSGAGTRFTVCTGQRVLLFPGKRILKSLCVIRYV